MLVLPRSVSLLGMVATGLLCSVPAAFPQTQPDESAQVISDEQRSLETCREGILDPDVQFKGRRRWVEHLFSYRSEQSNALVVELLRKSDRPEVQQAVCDVIADRSVSPAERLIDAYVEPLIALLGAESHDLRALAAKALADYAEDGVPETLGKLAARSDAPLDTRLAAIDALSPNTHRREVVEQLVHLLDTEAPKIADRVVDALAPLVPQPFGRDFPRWKSWWAAKSELSNESWLEEQLQFQRDRRRRVEDALHRYRVASEIREQAAVTRSGTFQRELYRTLGEEPREVKLTEWLDDPLAHVKRAAMSIIKERMGDDGQRPTDDVLTSLLALLSDESPRVRREALEIARNLSAPAVVEAVVAQLEREKDTETRCAFFEALGTLHSPEAVVALVNEIHSSQTESHCVREAAVALGRIGEQANVADRFPEAVSALNQRYRNASAEETSLRTALLAGMVGVADPSFDTAFLDAVDSDNPRILREAIRGLRAIENTSKMPRLRTLTDHPDALVRIEATDIIGLLGREEVDLERLLPRLGQATESNAAVRETAWRRFCEFFGRRPVSERIAAADRLRQEPELEVKYLVALVEDFSAHSISVPELEGILDRLADTLLRQSRYAEAAQHLQALYELQRRQSPGASIRTGLRLLGARLRSSANPNVSELLGELATAERKDVQSDIVQTISDYLDAKPANGSAESLRSLLEELKTIPIGLFGAEWIALVERVEGLCATVKAGTESTAAPQPRDPDGP